MHELAVEAFGMITAVGLNAPAACAAIRCGLTHFSETRFMDRGGRWITAAEVPMPEPFRGRARIVRMAAAAIREALAGMDGGADREMALFLCLAEAERPGGIPAPGGDDLLGEVEALLETRFHPQSMVIAGGRVGSVRAIQKAQEMLSGGRCRYCVVAGSDTYLTAATLSACDDADRLLTESNSDGFIPGEAGAAVVLTRLRHAVSAVLTINGIGFGREPAHIRSGLPLRADGLVQAIRQALAMAGQELGDLDLRICDLSGEQYGFKEAALALTRILRTRKESFDIRHPAECLGETGAAIVPCVLALASTAVLKGYAKGRGILCHFGNDNGQRAAVVLNAIHPQRKK